MTEGASTTRRASEAAPGPAWVPVLATAIMMAAIWIAQLQLIPVGGFHFYDEFHTLDRSSAFAVHGDWLTVYSLQEPGFQKPPLQYWMTAALLETGLDLQTALRLPSLIFSLGSMAAVALLAFAVSPGTPWAMPAAVLLFASSGQYWEHALSAMLESGAVLFATLALAAAILALRDPRWWYAAGIAIALGALQKAPIGLILVALWLALLNATSARHGVRFRDIARERPFRIAAWIAVLSTLAWPVFQTARYGAEALDEFFGDQIVDRFLPGDDLEDVRSLAVLSDLIIGGEPWLRWPAIAALAWLPWRLRRMELLPLPLTFAVFVAAMMLAGGHVTARYTLLFLPLLAVALAAVILSLVPRPWLALPLVALASWGGGWPIKDAAGLRLDQNPNYSEQIAALSRVGETLKPDETLVVCIFPGPRRIIPAVASRFAAEGRPFVRLAKEGDIDEYAAEGRLDGPLRGVCRPDELETISARLADLRIDGERNGYVIWTARAMR